MRTTKQTPYMQMIIIWLQLSFCESNTEHPRNLKWIEKLLRTFNPNMKYINIPNVCDVELHPHVKAIIVQFIFTYEEFNAVVSLENTYIKNIGICNSHIPNNKTKLSHYMFTIYGKLCLYICLKLN